VLCALTESDARSIGDLATQVGMAKNTIRNAVKHLEAAGVVLSVERSGRHELMLSPERRGLIMAIVSLESSPASAAPVPAEEMSDEDWDAVAAYYVAPRRVVVPAGVTEWHPDEEGQPVTEAAWAGRGPLD
jgi:DNA-binding IclR family transcriptional regulator